MSDQLVRGFWQSRRTSAGLAERRALEPICTALLVRNDKLALQNCQKALRVRPYNPPVQALFAVTLARLDKLEDALAVAEEVAKDIKGAGKALGDSGTLKLVAWVFEQKALHVKALEMWELATQKHAASLDLIFEAADYFIRIGAFKSLENVCKATVDAKHESHKAYPQAYEHLVWSYIVAVIIQAGDLQNPLAKVRISSANSQNSPETVYKSLQDCLSYFNTVALTPAKATTPSTSTAADASVCKNPHTFYLLLKVLRYLAEAPESVKVDSKAAKSQLLAILSSPQGLEYCQKDLTIDLFRREAVLALGTAQEWSNLQDIMMKKLDEGDCNWSTILTATQAAYGCVTGSTAVSSEASETTDALRAALPSTWWNSPSSELPDGESSATSMLVKLKTRLEQLGNDEGFSKKDRSLTLGLLKLASWFPKQPHPSLSDLVIIYLRRHANKACCFSDLREYLALLDEDGRQAVRAWLDDNYSTGDIDVQTLQSMECSMTAEKIRRYLPGRYGSVEEELQRGHRLAKAYFSAVHFGKDLIATDLQPNDELALLAAQCYLGAWEQAQRSSQYLELAIAILEFAIRRSKYRFQIRVLLIRLYQIAGAPSLVLKHYKLMDTKQIQYDTLAHWALDRGSTFFASLETGKQGSAIPVDSEVSSFSGMLEMISAWYPKADEETTYSVSQAWGSNAYYLIEDYTAFKDRLSCSLSRTAVSFETVRATVLGAPIATTGKYESARRVVESIAQQKAEFNDNRDYSILPDHQPSEQDSILKQTQLAARVDTRWVKQLASLYSAFSEGTATDFASVSEGSNSAATTDYEAKLLQWAGPVLTWLSGKEPKIEDVKVLQFLKDCHADLMRLTTNESLWPIYHIAQIALEAYCLLDTAFSNKSNNPGDFKGIKQFKQIRQDSKGSMKAISSRLKALNEDLSRKYKARNKLEALLPLKQFEEVSEDFLFDVATQLLDSRKSGLLQLANAITKRTSGP
ncbi:hypothetical protein P389DRAFT_103808 [Cystobasidium minutum MCA 4210]|uniref:uncharacterized protein n=1 Tax=Cystobasidium minutum MCA 4210 TaxID=1397322 RepID=UPI0034CD906A|eukprot:jgi/Rhomi1/103808/CE103807_5757